jgi:hypothetical protein
MVVEKEVSWPVAILIVFAPLALAMAVKRFTDLLFSEWYDDHLEGTLLGRLMERHARWVSQRLDWLRQDDYMPSVWELRTLGLAERELRQQPQLSDDPLDVLARDMGR